MKHNTPVFRLRTGCIVFVIQYFMLRFQIVIRLAGAYSNIFSIKMQ